MSPIILKDIAALEVFAGRLGLAMRDHPAVVYLSGELGAGKTALVRALFAANGVGVPVKSPSYTLLEPYQIHGRETWHLDLYRLTDAEELEILGIRDFDPTVGYLFVEWPERGAGHLPAADLRLEIRFAGEGRELDLVAASETGEAILGRLSP